MSVVCSAEDAARLVAPGATVGLGGLQGNLAPVEAEPRLLLVRAVAGVAMPREDRLDLGGEIHLAFRPRLGGKRGGRPCARRQGRNG